VVLAKLNLLHLLKELYGCVHFARSVYDETVIEGLRQGYEDARTLRLFLDQVGWRPEAVESEEIPAGLFDAPLDQGERDTLALAESMPSALVLIDETVGRQVARDRGLAVRGSLGVLVEAY
jgi:predicted nucleic acid-binding protein